MCVAKSAVLKNLQNVYVHSVGVGLEKIRNDLSLQQNLAAGDIIFVHIRYVFVKF